MGLAVDERGLWHPQHPPTHSGAPDPPTHPPTQCTKSKAEWWEKQSASPTSGAGAPLAAWCFCTDAATAENRPSPCHLLWSLSIRPPSAAPPATHGPPLYPAVSGSPPLSSAPWRKDTLIWIAPILAFQDSNDTGFGKVGLAFCDPSPLEQWRAAGKWNWHLVQGCPERLETAWAAEPALSLSPRPAVLSWIHQCEALAGIMGHGSQTWWRREPPSLTHPLVGAIAAPAITGVAPWRLVLRGVQGNAACERAKMKDFSTTLDSTASGQQVTNNKDDDSDRSPCRSETVPIGTVHTVWGLEAHHSRTPGNLLTSWAEVPWSPRLN